LSIKISRIPLDLSSMSIDYNYDNTIEK